MSLVHRQISRHAAPLRRDATEAEKAIWSALRNRQLGGFKFRRQWTIEPYVADFACIEARLVVELDGGQHTPERDAIRTRSLQERGWRVIRFWNGDVFERREGVLDTILSVLTEQLQKKTLTQPSPAKAGEG